MKFLDVLLLAFRTVRSNKLRTGLTVAIIALGIFALILIVTAIGAIEQKFTESFSTMVQMDLPFATRNEISELAAVIIIENEFN